MHAHDDYESLVIIKALAECYLGNPVEKSWYGLRGTQNGVWLECHNCSQKVMLPWVDDRTKDAVHIGALDGWTAPPLCCPKCWTNDKRPAGD